MELKSLKDAVASVENGLEDYGQNPSDIIRDGCIQRFEYTYELSLTMIKRFLKERSLHPTTLSQASFKEIIREAIGQGILRENLEQWTKYRYCRNRTSHNYNQEIAQEIFHIIPSFLNEAHHLIKQLEKKTEKM